MNDDDMPRDPLLSGAYRQAAGGEPPAALDALILAAARKEAAQRPQVRRVPWWRRAMLPVGVFATLVVTVSLVLMVEQEQRDLLPAPVPAPALAPAAPLPAPAETAQPTAQDLAKAAAEARREERARLSAKPAAAPAPAEGPQLAPAPPPAMPGGTADGELRERRAESASTAGAAMPKKEAPSAEPAAAAKSASGAAPAPAAPSVSLPAPAQFAVPRRDLKAADKAEVAKAPAAWLDEIRRLRGAGQEAEAQVQLAAFRRAYPDYPVPDDLK